MRLSALFAAAGVWLIAAGVAQAGGYRMLRLEGSFVKWGAPQLGSGATITYALARQPRNFPDARNCKDLVPIDPMEGTGSVPSGLLNVLHSAFAAWQAAADLHFRPATDADRADILIGAQGHPHGWAFTNVAPDAHPRPLVAAAFGPGRPPDSVVPIARSVICLNPEAPWKSGFDGNLNAFDLRYVFLHEIGHAIGLDHPGPSGEIMSFRYEERFEDLQDGDIAGVVRLYGPRPLSASMALAPRPRRSGSSSGSAPTPDREGLTP